MKAQCDRCSNALTNWDYRYQGLHYCRTCYDILFKVRICSICNTPKMIFTKLNIPVCKICQVKDSPCIRCGKKDYSFGKITKDGSVCLSCSTYFREYKECARCNVKSYTVYNKTIKDGESKPLCANCYNKTLPTCIKCHKQRKAFSHNEKGQPICKICTEKGEKNCKRCGNLFPAGMGNICSECIFEKSLEKRAIFGSKSLSVYNTELFYKFSYWLAKRRGTIFASNALKNYYPMFLDIDKYAQKIGRYPTYLELLKKFTSTKLNKYSLVITFLNERKVLSINLSIKEEYANINKINKDLDTFSTRSYRSEILHAYYETLYSKYTKGKTTIRSIRLAITPAVKFLEYTTQTVDQKISNHSLHNYLWVYAGQKSAITGFISFLNKKYNLILKIPKEPIEFFRPKKSKAQLKQLYIDALRDDSCTLESKQKLLILSIECLHDISIPKNVILPLHGIKQKKNGDCYMRLGAKEFYIPIETYHYTRN